MTQAHLKWDHPRDEVWFWALYEAFKNTGETPITPEGATERCAALLQDQAELRCKLDSISRLAVVTEDDRDVDRLVEQLNRIFITARFALKEI